MQIWSRKGCFCSQKAGLSGYQEKYHSPVCIAVIQTCRFSPRGRQERPHMTRYCSAGLRNCKNKNSDIVSISEFLGGGEGGIRTLAPVIPAYSLSRGAPSAILGYFSISMQLLAEREGFEPPVPRDITSFQDWRLKPLGHLSTETPAKIILPDSCPYVNSAELNDS